MAGATFLLGGAFAKAFNKELVAAPLDVLLLVLVSGACAELEVEAAATTATCATSCS